MYKLYTIDNQFIKETQSWPTIFTGIIKHSDGSKTWYSVGKRHRLDGPACEYFVGTKEWHIEGKRHRLGGPVIEYPNGRKKWFLDGVEITKEYHNILYNIMRLKGLT